MPARSGTARDAPAPVPRFRMLFRPVLAACAAAVAALACARPPAVAPSAPETRVSRVLLFIADGAGTEYWTAAKLSRARLAVDQFPVAGLVVTSMADAHVTDSAAGATALATGTRSYQGAIGVGPECRELLLADSVALRENPALCEPLESVFDVARRRGMATGVVTTTLVTDATPAAFVAKAARRAWTQRIAEQYAAFGLDVMMGSGEDQFNGTRWPGARDLLTPLCAVSTCVTTPEQLARYSGERPLVALFGRRGSMRPAGERDPPLPVMVAAALRRLERDPDGFVAVLESEGTDIAGHNNTPLSTIVAEMLEFDDAVAVGLAFARRTPGTLVIVTADHETGGLALLSAADTAASAEQNQGIVASYATGRHTAAMVPLFAYGPGAERFGGIRHNDEIGRTLKELIGR